MNAAPFRLLGPLEVTGAAGRVYVSPGRQEVILAALLLDLNRMVSTDHLVDVVWEDDPPETARTQIQICVSRIRKSLTAGQVEATIETRPRGYILHAPDRATDVIEFARTVEEARALAGAGDNHAAAMLLREALTLWRGACLIGIPSGVLARRAMQLDETRLGCFETCVDLELDLGRHHQLVSELYALVREHPLRERLRGQLMVALYRCGRQAEALETYRQVRDMLADELGLDPGMDLQNLERAILENAPNLTAPAPAPAATGSRREPDPETAASAPPASTAPRQLPADAPDFVSDPTMLASICAALTARTDGAARNVVLLTGLPGIGKSTVAVHVAHQLSAQHFPDGQLYCDLHGVRSQPVDPAEALGRFLRALGVPVQALPASIDERAAMYRDLLAARRMIIVLDDAAGEAQIGPLMPGSGGCAVLITSRHGLIAMPGTQRFELAPLEFELARELLARGIGAERVEAEPVAAQSLLSVVGGLPLAIRIVAARMVARPHWSLESMRQRLSDEHRRLDELAHGDLSIRASLSLSYNGLSAESRRLLRLTGVAGGTSLPGWIGGALAGDDTPLPSDLLEPLVDARMLEVMGVRGRSELRFSVHQIVRAFAHERAMAEEPPEERRAAIQRVVGGWTSLVEQAHARIYGGHFTLVRGDGERWRPPASYVAGILTDPLAWLDGESSNLCATVELAARTGLTELCWELATSLVTLFEARGYVNLWERSHGVALEAVRQSGNERGTAAVLSSLGTLNLYRGHTREATGQLIEALTIFRRIGHAGGEALCLRDLALIDRQRGNDEQALAHYEAAERAFTSAGDVVGRAHVLGESAFVLMRGGEFDRTRANLDEALRTYRETGFARGETLALRRLGQMFMHQDEPEKAERILREVLDRTRAAGDLVGQGHVLHDLGVAQARMGRDQEAADHLGQSAEARDRVLDRVGAATVRLDLARLLSQMERSAEAAACLDEAISALRETGSADLLGSATDLWDKVGHRGAAADPSALTQQG